MRKVLAVFAALAVAAGVVVFWQPIAAAGDAVAPAAHHPITRGVPGQRQAAGLLRDPPGRHRGPQPRSQRATQRIRPDRPAHRRIVIIASTGDSGYGVSYPAQTS
jgi:hypothetical protein